MGNYNGPIGKYNRHSDSYEAPALTPEQQIEQHLVDAGHALYGSEHRIVADPVTGYLTEAVKSFAEIAKIMAVQMRQMKDSLAEMTATMEKWKPFLDQMERDHKINESLLQDFPNSD